MCTVYDEWYDCAYQISRWDVRWQVHRTPSCCMSVAVTLRYSPFLYSLQLSTAQRLAQVSRPVVVADTVALIEDANALRWKKFEWQSLLWQELNSNLSTDLTPQLLVACQVGHHYWLWQRMLWISEAAWSKRLFITRSLLYERYGWTQLPEICKRVKITALGKLDAKSGIRRHLMTSHVATSRLITGQHSARHRPGNVQT